MRLHQSSLRGILGFCQGRLVFFGGGGLLAGVSAVFLMGLLGAMLLPSVPERAQAVEGDGGATTYATGASVSLGVPATIDFEAVTPTANGATTTATANVTVATTNSAGYSLYLYAEGGNNLVAQNPATTEVVTATASSTTLDGLANNTWGYNLGTAAPEAGTTYAAVPTDGTTPVQTKDTSSTNAANDTYTLALGAKVDTTIPSGTYTGALTVAVVAEAAKVVFNGITTMQEMTPDICSNALENDTTRLIDSRDGKYYWVAKLADGNCWMTQNLDFDLSTDTTLTSVDSDVISSWTPTISTEPEGTVTDNSSYTGTYSWDLGMYVKTDPSGYSNDCGSVKSLADPSCSSVGWTNVSSMAPMSDSTSNVAISGNTYNAHYLVGNFYQWNAATAGTGVSTNSRADAAGSICPLGWKLPSNSTSGDGSFYYLLQQYDLNTSYNGILVTQYPLFFTPYGIINGGTLGASGSEGYYWSSTLITLSMGGAVDAFAFHENSRNLSDYIPSFGFSVRCLADGNTTTGGGDSADNN